MDPVKRGRSWDAARRFASVAASAGLCLTLLGSGCGGSTPGQSPKDGGGIDVGPGDGGAPDGDAGGGVLDEQSLIYAVYEEFGDDRLPASVPRLTDNNPDSTIMLEVARRFPSLSAEAQAILDPFLRPPSDPESWYATHELIEPSAAPLAFDEETAEAPNLRCSVLATYQVKVTAHTNIWYRTGDGRGEALATVLAAVAEKIYNDVTGLFGRFPPTDVNATSKCNGGDGALDIYLVPFPADPDSVRGRTIPYGSACGATPSFIELNMWANLDQRKVEAVLAHEFFHVLQMGTYTFAAACSDYDWLGEATANWVIDYVFHDNQTEVPHAAGYMTGERKVPLDEPYTFADADKTNGYADYVFFEYLTLKSSSAAMRTIWDTTERRDSVGATAAGMDAGGGAKVVWPRFALATWNDATAGVQNDLAVGDPAPPRLDWGLKKIYDLRDAGGTDGDPSTPVKLEGNPGKTFKLMQTAAGSSGVELERLSIHADYFKFMDNNVRSVLYVNASRVAIVPDANLKIQALIKKDGSWGAPEDWTKVQMKAFCRDVTDERIEELVLIYSNSNPMRPADPIVVDPPPQLSVSNVGCWRWQGTTSVEEQASGGGASSMITASGLNVIFERWRPPGLPEGATGTELFQLLSGTVYANSTTFQGCTTTAMGSGPIPMGVGSGSLNVSLGVDLGLGEPPDRTVAGSGASSAMTHSEIACPGGDPIPIDGDMAWSWMELPQLGEQVVEVLPDGTIQGSYTRTFMVPLAGTRKMTWMLSPVRQ